MEWSGGRWGWRWLGVGGEGEGRLYHDNDKISVDFCLLELFLAQCQPDRIENWSICTLDAPSTLLYSTNISSTFQGIMHSLTKLVPEHSSIFST